MIAFTLVAPFGLAGAESRKQRLRKHTRTSLPRTAAQDANEYDLGGHAAEIDAAAAKAGDDKSKSKR